MATHNRILLYCNRTLLFLLVMFNMSCVQSQQNKNTLTNSTKAYTLVYTNNKLAALSSSMGEDRLGSPKLTYLDSNIVLKVVDSANNWYRVQLSQFHFAYIDKKHVQIVVNDTSSQYPPMWYTKNLVAQGTDSCYDILTMNTDARVPYKAWTDIYPSVIKVNLFGIRTNTNWIIQYTKTLQEVKEVFYNQPEEDMMELTIVLKHKQHWGFSIQYNQQNQLQIKVKRQPKFLTLDKLKIAIDAGHGGNNVGTEGVKSHIAEKTLTLIYAQELEKQLRKNKAKNIVVTRRTDTSIDMRDRIFMHQINNPDLLLSIHFNSSNMPEVSGTSTYYKHIGFKPLSYFILQRLLQLKFNEYGHVGNFNFGLNNPTDFVNALIEVGFLSHVEEEKKLLNAAFQKKVAEQIIKGLKDWLATCNELQ